MAKNLNEMLDTMTPERRERITARAAAILADMPLQELRRARQFSQVTLAKAMDIPQSNISRIERQVDAYVSTLSNYVTAMGGRLDIVASFPDGSYRINQFEDIGEPDDTQGLLEM